MNKGFKKIIIGVIVFIAGIILPLIPIIEVFFQDDITFQAPGSIEVSIGEPGEYCLWHNYKGVFKGQSYSFERQLPEGLSFFLTEKESGSTVPMKTDSSVSSESGSKKKASIGYFEIKNSGKYLLSISGNAQKRVFSFGRSISEKIFSILGNILISLVFAFIAVIVSFVLIVLGIIDIVRIPKSDTQIVQDTV